MVTLVDEIERKHEGIGLSSEFFADLPNVRAVLGPDHQSLAAVYYDTADLRLGEAGITLRRRTGGADEGWHAKVPVGPEHRREVHFPLTEPGDVVPGDMRALLLGHTAGRPLKPVARIATERDRWQLVDAGGTVLAEVVGDNVTGRAIGHVSGHAQVFQEIEIELHAGDHDLLEEISRRLTEAGAPRSQRSSKLATVLRTRRAAPAPLRRNASVADVLHRYLCEQVAALRAADLALRLNQPDGLHDLRVAVRRLRSCLRVFRTHFTSSGIRTATTELAWLSDLLGAARDLEVLHATIGDAVHALPDDLVLGPVSADLQRALAKREATTMGEVTEALSGSRYLTLQNALDNLTTNRHFRSSADRPAAKTLPRQIAKAYRKVGKAVDKARDNDPAALHRVRRRTKRLRYACEAVEPVIGEPAGRTRRDAKRIQRTLGEHHDGVRARIALRELGARARTGGGNGFTFGLVHGQLGERATGLEARFARQWQQLSRRRSRRWLR